MAKSLPFREASDIIKRILSVKINKETVRNATEYIGKRALEQDTQEVHFDPDKAKCKETTFLEIDGVMVNTLKGWKEYKLGLFYSKSDVKSAKKNSQRVSLKNRKLIGAITSDYANELKQFLVSRMKQTGHYWSNKVVLISDGADWIAKLFQSMFPNSEMILDWYHAMENLWRCGNQLFGEGSQLAVEWVSVYKELLWNGEIDLVLERLWREASSCKNQTPVRRLYLYYEHRKDRMKYKEFREKGYPIGSGCIESANSYSVQNRLKQSRMRWLEENANDVAHLRNKYFSGEWDQIWKQTA